MCFSPLMSWATAGLGISVAVFAKSKNKPANLYVAPAYFGFMEILQGLMYWQVHHPSTIIVNILVYIAYIHVCFQPLVFNFWLGTFISERQKAVYHFTLKLCAVGAVFLLIRMLVAGDSPLCSSYETLCAPTPNIFNGLYHIAWSLPLVGAGWNYIYPSIALHMFLFFIPGMLLGFYRLMIVFFFLGPFLAAQITPNPSEASSIWCVMGLWLMAITVLAAIRRPPRFFFPKNSG